MRLFSSVLAIAAAGIASSSMAATINLDLDHTATAGSPSVYTLNNDFTLPVGFTNAVLTITELNVDDRGVVLLNGTIVDSGGIFGPGTGSLVLTPGGPSQTFSFNGNGARNLAITTGFVAGLNAFSIVVNDTNNGIFGDPLPGGVNISTARLRATLTYDVSSVAPIPEPSSWALMIAGFGLAGAALRGSRVRVRFA
jgi:hypothetical protein